MPKSVVTTDVLMQPIAQFSFGVRAGDLICIGATAGTDASRRLAGSTAGLADMAAQAAQMFVNLDCSLRLLGGRLEDVVRVKSYITDWRELRAYEDAYARYFHSPYPSHSIVSSPGFPLPQATVEAEIMAIAGGGFKYPRPDDTHKGMVRQPRGTIMAGGHHYCIASPFDSRGEVGDPDPLTQTDLMFRNLAKTLETSGLEPQDVVMLNVTLSDIRDFPPFEEAFRRFFSAPYPARSVQAASLERAEMLVEVESFAVAGGGRPVFGLGQPACQGAASPGMLAGEYLYIGGQLGLLADNSMPTGVEAQVRAAWERIQAVVVEAGMHLDDVVHTSNCLTDWRSYAGFNAGFAPFVSPPYPPRATVLAGLVDPRALVQIEALAHAKGRDATFIEVKPIRTGEHA